MHLLFIFEENMTRKQTDQFVKARLYFKDLELKSEELVLIRPILLYEKELHLGLLLLGD